MTSSAPTSTPLTFDVTTMKLSDGRTVIEVGEAMGPHPHPDHNGKLVPISTVNLLLVESPSGEPQEMYACDWPGGDICGKTYDNIKSVTSHQTFHSPTKGNSRYPIETLKLVIRTVKTCKRDMGSRGSMQATADILNEQKVPTVKGEPWTSQSVSSLYNQWEPKIPVRVYRKRTANEPVSSPPANEKIDVSTASPRATGAAPIGTTMLAALNHLRNQFALTERAFITVAEAAHDLVNQVDKYGTVNDEIRDKAEKYDALRKMLGQSD